MALTLDQIARARALRAQMRAAGRAVAASTEDADTLLSCAGMFDSWRPDVGYAAGTVLRHGDGLYRVRQAVHSLSHQPPDGKGLLAVYAPVQAPPPEGQVLRWMYGETVDAGERREHNRIVYECYAPGGAGANIHTPGLVPAIWRAVT